jgi:phosphohistidine phosphatase
MKTLYLLRHAKSSWDFPHLSDHDRPLNNRGRNDAPLMGEQLAKRNIKPDLILSSPAVRAITTATLVAKEIDYDLDKIEIKERAYHADPAELLAIIQETPSRVEGLMLVGHNDGMTDLVNQLSPTYIENVPTAGVVSLSFDTSSWKEVSPQNARFNFFDYPKNYK